jgi:hypothetical protein
MCLPNTWRKTRFVWEVHLRATAGVSYGNRAAVKGATQRANGADLDGEHGCGAYAAREGARVPCRAASRTKACAVTKAGGGRGLRPMPLIAAKEKTPASRPADCIRPRYRKLPPDERERVAAGVSASGNALLM